MSEWQDYKGSIFKWVNGRSSQREEHYISAEYVNNLEARVKELEAERDILYKGVFYYAVNSYASSDVADRTLDAYDKLKKGEE